MTVIVPSVPTPVPQASDAVNFDARADAYHTAFPGIVAAQNAQNVENNAINANVNARLALTEAAALAALGNAQLAATSAGATAWVSGTTYGPGLTRWSPANGRVYRRTGASAVSSLDPSVDTANWRDVAMDVETGLPNVRPTLLMDLAGTAQLDPRAVFTRASTGRRYNAAGLLALAAANVPRFEFNALTRDCRGLLVEASHTNLWLQSEGLPTLFSSVITSTEAAVAPDGTTTADKLAANTSLAPHGGGRSVALTSGTTYTFSYFVKAAGVNFAGLSASSGAFGTATQDVFDLVNGVVTVNQSGTAAIRSVGNGWFLCSISRTATVSASSNFSVFLFQGADGAEFVGDGVAGIFIWGGMLTTAGAVSYISTTSSSVTRSADLAAFTGANFAAWHRSDEGSICLEASFNTEATTRALFAINDNTANNQIALVANEGQIRLIVTAGGVQQVSLAAGAAPALGVPFRVALAYKAGDFAVSLNGATAVTSTSGALPSCNQARLGAMDTGASQMNGHLRRVAFYPARLSSGQLQALSAL